MCSGTCFNHRWSKWPQFNLHYFKSYKKHQHNIKSQFFLSLSLSLVQVTSSKLVVINFVVSEFDGE